MSQADNRQGRRKSPPDEPAGGITDPAADHCVGDRVFDRERLIWDPEYRAEIAHLLRQRAAPRS